MSQDAPRWPPQIGDWVMTRDDGSTGTVDWIETRGDTTYYVVDYAEAGSTTPVSFGPTSRVCTLEEIEPFVT